MSSFARKMLVFWIAFFCFGTGIFIGGWLFRREALLECESDSVVVMGSLFEKIVRQKRVPPRTIPTDMDAYFLGKIGYLESADKGWINRMRGRNILSEARIQKAISQFIAYQSYNQRS